MMIENVHLAALPKVSEILENTFSRKRVKEIWDEICYYNRPGVVIVFESWYFEKIIFNYLLYNECKTINAQLNKLRKTLTGTHVLVDYNG